MITYYQILVNNKYKDDSRKIVRDKGSIMNNGNRLKSSDEPVDHDSAARRSTPVS